MSLGSNERLTFGPSLIRTAGIPSLGMAEVFHQLGAPSKAIFSSVVNCFTSSGILAFKNSWDIVLVFTTVLELGYVGRNTTTLVSHGILISALMT